MERKTVRARKVVGNLNDEIRMRLLVLLPTFQKLVAMIRTEFEIPRWGFEDEDTKLTWWNRLDKKERFSHHIDFLCAEFQLPDHLAQITLRNYVLMNTIIVPNKNWFIDTVEWEPALESLNVKYITLRVYGALTQKDFSEIKARIRREQKRLPKSRARDLGKIRNFERSIKILEHWMSRSGHPILRKHYGGYLARAIKQNNPDKKELHRLEKLNRNDVWLEFDQPTSGKIGDELDTTSFATRKAAQRLNGLSKELFGVAILEDKKLIT
jgi:hypothetical protein